MDTGKNSSFVKQAAILAASGILSRVIGFLYRLPLTNSILLDEGNGIFGAGYSIYNLFLIISSAGLPVAISKMVSERIAQKQYKNAHRVFQVSMMAAAAFGFVCSLVLFFGAGFLSNFINYPQSYTSLLTLAPTIFIVAIMSVYRGYFQGMSNTAPTAVSQMIEQIFNAVSTVLLAWLIMKNFNDFALGAAGATLGTGIGALAGLGILLFIYRMAKPGIISRCQRTSKGVKVVESNKKILRELIVTTLPIIAGAAIFGFTILIDTKMVMGRLTLNDMFSEAEASRLFGQLSGKYVTITTLPVAISTSIATASIPSIAASMVMKEKKAASHKINTALRLAMMLSIPAATGIGVLSNQILRLLFPSQSGGGDLLRIGAVSIVFLSLAQITTGMLQGISKMHIPALAALVGCLVKIPINYTLIAMPSININGAVIGTTACYVVASAIDLAALAVITKIKLDYVGMLVKPLISSAIMGMACYIAYYLVYLYIPSNVLAVIFAIFVGVVIYFTAMLYLKGLSRNDILMLPMGSKIVKKLDRFNIL